MKLAKERVIVTSALPYINAIPHLGNIAGSHLPADIFARYCRLKGFETVFIGGSDEHGTAMEVAAHEEGLTPRQLCDRNHKIHKKIYEWFNISYDNYSRTSRQVNHDMTTLIFNRLHKNGYIKKEVIVAPYCEKDKMYLADRYVEGVCPKCGFEGARGDQCEKCSSLLNPQELKKSYCVMCKSAPVFKEEKHLFIDFNKLSPKIEAWVKNSKQWKSNVRNLALGWIKEGLEKRCITRNLSWGVKVPLKGFKHLVFYVWFDAPIGYISSTKEWAENIKKPREWEKYWKGSKAKLVHFLGKDNIPFHTIFWPGMLIGAGGFNLPWQVGGLEYLNYENDKFSKSRGVGVFCDDIQKLEFSPDIWRFYLSSVMPETRDTEFSWRDFRDRINNELVANFGNFAYRTLSFTSKHYGEIPRKEPMAADQIILKRAARLVKDYDKNMYSLQFKEALKNALAVSALGNKYFQDTKPWDLIKKDKDRCGAVLNTCARLAGTAAILLHPFIPDACENLWRQLGNKTGIVKHGLKVPAFKAGQKLGKPSILFKKIEDKTIEKYRKKFGGKVKEDPASTLDLRVATISSVQNHPRADNLYVLGIDLGRGRKRQLVASVKNWYDQKELRGKSIVIVANMETAKVRGVRSEGMLLAAEKGERAGLLTAPKSRPGDEAFFEGLERRPAKKVSLKGFSGLDIRTDEKGVLYKGKRLKAGTENIKAEKVPAGARVC